jgi:predicted esterase
MSLAMVLSSAGADEPESKSAAPPDTIALSDYLVLPAAGQYGRLPLHRDAVEAQLVAGTWKLPADGDTIESLDGRRETWRAAKADEKGTLDTQKLRGGYALATFDSPAERIMLLEAAGHAMVYVNGEPRAGDPYSLGWLRLPVLVRAGQNTLLFHIVADKLQARFTTPPADAFLLDQDHTLPTIARGKREPDWYWAAVPIVNATNDWLDDLRIECGPDGAEPVFVRQPPVPPLSVYKAAFHVPRSREKGDGPVRYAIRLTRVGDAEDETGEKPAVSQLNVELRRVGPHDMHLRTFRSYIDGSVQPYAVLPAAKANDDDRLNVNEGDIPTGMIVTLHDAGASCEDHLASYAPKPWAHIVAPQGRRPHGFDWEAWARSDVSQAMLEAWQFHESNPRRRYLTGYAMGGHGAWQLGASRPDQFAAIGPAAGWISFATYGGGMPPMETANEIDALLLRSYSASDTLRLLTNLSNTGVYVLHGADDQTVPVAQARFMRSRLASFHPNFVYQEVAGAGHWWGAECCDSPRLIEFFKSQSIAPPAEQTVVDFTTANPAVASQCHWLSIEAQQQQLSPSHVAIRQNLEARTFVGNTSNVARLSIEVAQLPAGQPIDVTLDGQALHWLKRPSGQSARLWFERQGDQWLVSEPPSPQLKGPARNGTFNAAFGNDVLLVYGTAGTEEENAWAAAKARYDAETFYYRANGSLEVLPDTRFDMNADDDRSVILYGNADTNRAWPLLCATSPVEARRGQVRVGTRTEAGDDLALLMVRPRAGSDVALVGIVGGTGSAGMRLTDRLRWFVSGIVYPDLMILEPDVLSAGTAGVRAWGFFGPDWQVDGGEIAWRDAAP